MHKHFMAVDAADIMMKDNGRIEERVINLRKNANFTSAGGKKN